MVAEELIGIARRLASDSSGGGPTETELRRAVSSAYYAMFHTLCAACADALAGPDPASRDPESWLLVYRALEHGYARNRFSNDAAMGRFPDAIGSFGGHFIKMQARRQAADYDPSVQFEPQRVRTDIEDTARVIAGFTSLLHQDLRALALYLLLRPRRE